MDLALHISSNVVLYEGYWNAPDLTRHALYFWELATPLRSAMSSFMLESPT
jgi:hypothetical protein